MERRELLKLYLNRYNKTKNRIKELDKTYHTILSDAEVPYQSSYSKDTKVRSSSSGNNGMLNILVRLEEIKERIETQKKLLVELAVKIFDVLDFLPVESEWRSLLEMKYIQKQSDKAIYRSLYISKSQFYKLLNQALDELLRYSKVNKILDDFEKELNEDTTKLCY